MTARRITSTQFKLSPTPPAEISAHIIDFSTTPVAGYHSPMPHFALIIDNFLTPEECEALVSFATDSDPDATWEPALVNIGFGQQMKMSEIRDCGRIMVDDPDIAGMLFDRVLPFLPDDIKVLEPEGHWGKSLLEYVGRWADGGIKRDTWRVKRMNERLRFLRYEKGNYFKQHRDGSYPDPLTGQQSFLTFQLYLSDDKGVKGGATRFFRFRDQYDVEPKMGRVLIFQHAGLEHSGADVEEGVKITVRSDIMYERVESE